MGTFPIMLLLMQWTRFQVSFQAYENLESLDWSRSTISEVGHFTPAFISTFFSHHQFNMDHLSNLAANDSYTMERRKEYANYVFANFLCNSCICWRVFVKAARMGPIIERLLENFEKRRSVSLDYSKQNTHVTHGRAFRKQRFPSIQKFLIFLKAKRLK